MKLLSYSRKGEVSFGIGKSNGLIDLGERLKNKLPAKTIINFLTFFGHDFLEKFVNHPVDFSYFVFLLRSDHRKIVSDYYNLNHQ